MDFEGFFSILVPSICQSPTQELLDQAYQVNDQYMRTPGYAEFLFNTIKTTDQPYVLHCAAINLKNQIKAFWENEEMYTGKQIIRDEILNILLAVPENMHNIIINIIDIIAKSDYPHNWPDLMETVTTIINNEETQLPIISLLMELSQQIFSHLEFSSRSDALFKQIDHSLSFWDQTSLDLLQKILPAHFNANGDQALIENCYKNLIKIIHYLSTQELPQFYYDHLLDYFTYINELMQLPGAFPIKIEICKLFKIYLVRYYTDIEYWGTKENNPKTPEEIEALGNVFNLILENILLLVAADNAPTEELVIAAFDPLIQLLRSKGRTFFLQEDRLNHIVSQILIPCISLTEEELLIFDEEPLKYVQNSIEGDTMSKRSAVYRFLKEICRRFKEQMRDTFTQYMQQLLLEYNTDPEGYWQNMNTTIFIMGTLAAEKALINDNVIQVAEGYDIEEFIVNFILPQLPVGNNKFVLQTDALKFLVDYRNVIQIENIVQYLPYIAALIKSSCDTVKIFAEYTFERFLTLRNFKVLPDGFFQCVNLEEIIQDVISTFVVHDIDNNVFSAKCLLRIVAQGKELVLPYSKLIITTVCDYLMKLADEALEKSRGGNANFIHNLMEVLVAIVTRAHANVLEVEQIVVNLFLKVIEQNISDFVPYIFQIMAGYMLCYPEGVMINDFYLNQFQHLLNPNLWISSGNIPAMTILLDSFCAKVPDYITTNIVQILSICESLLPGTRSHPHAFSIFVSILKYIQPEFSIQYLPTIFQMVAQQLETGNALKYKQSYALFMCNAAIYLGPENAINQLSDLHLVQVWADSLPLIRMRNNLEIAIFGMMKILTEGQLPDDLWGVLFVGTVKMIESPDRNFIEQEIAAMKEQEEANKEFDTTFSKLIYGDVITNDPLECMHTVDIVNYMAEKFAAFSQQCPGVLEVAIQKLPSHLQNAFINYQTRFGVQFL